MIGNKLKELIKQKKISQKTLAKQLGVTEACISHYINNKRIPKFETVVKIAKYCCVDISFFVDN